MRTHLTVLFCGRHHMTLTVTSDVTKISFLNAVSRHRASTPFSLSLYSNPSTLYNDEDEGVIQLTRVHAKHRTCKVCLSVGVAFKLLNATASHVRVTSASCTIRYP